MTSSPKNTTWNKFSSRRLKISAMGLDRAFLSMAQMPNRIRSSGSSSSYCSYSSLADNGPPSLSPPDDVDTDVFRDDEVDRKRGGNASAAGMRGGGFLRAAAVVVVEALKRGELLVDDGGTGGGSGPAVDVVAGVVTGDGRREFAPPLVDSPSLSPSSEPPSPMPPPEMAANASSSRP